MKAVRITLFIISLLMIALFALGWRCFDLQYLRSDEYADRCAQQRLLHTSCDPQRGVILDSSGSILAGSNRTQVIFADTLVIRDANETAIELSPIINKQPSEILDIIENSGQLRPTIIMDANETQCSQASKIRGIGVESRWIRHYPSGRLMSNIIGFVSPPPFSKGLEGIEYKYNDQLSGSGTSSVFFKDVYRRPIRPKEQKGTLVDGDGIVLTIDTAIQQFAHDELEKQYKSYKAESALAIVAEPKTGEILAMVSLPDFDPTDVRNTDPNLFVSSAVIDSFEPGSIIKPFVVATALDNGIISTDEKIFCENGLYGGKDSGFGTIHEFRNGFGDLTPKGILINSSNIGMAKIGQRMGAEKIYKGLRMFGFGKPISIELPCADRSTGQLRMPQYWNQYSVTRVPYGQEISVTALQLIRAYCILCNDGRLVEPYIVKAIIGSNGVVTKLNRPTPPVAHVVKPDVARWITNDAMVAVVNEGSGKYAKLDKWQVFGKTGTANIYDRKLRRYSKKDYVASFIAGAPAGDPEIIVLVSIFKPDRSLGKNYTGGVVAAPVAARIIERTLTYRE